MKDLQRTLSFADGSDLRGGDAWRVKQMLKSVYIKSAKVLIEMQSLTGNPVPSTIQPPQTIPFPQPAGTAQANLYDFDCDGDTLSKSQALMN